MPDEPGQYGIVQKARRALLIESEDVHDAVCKKVLEERYEIPDYLPLTDCAPIEKL
jgi:hypothetical protein